MCSVNPDNVDFLIIIGIFLLGVGVVSFLTETTIADIKRDDYPFTYWFGTISLPLTGGMVLIGVQVC